MSPTFLLIKLFNRRFTKYSLRMPGNRRERTSVEDEKVERKGGIQLRTELDPELADKLRYIKKVLGIRKNSEAIRYLILEKYEKLITAEKK